MALTEQQQTSVLQLTQALFTATPGSIYLDALGAQLASGQSVANMAQSLSETPIFFDKSYASDLKPGDFADAFLKDLTGENASDENINLAKADIVNKMGSGTDQNGIIAQWLHKLATTPTTDPNWGAAAKHLLIENVKKIVDNLVGDSAAIDNKRAAVSFIVHELEAGKSFGSMTEWAMTTLNGVDHSHPIWGKAAQRFDNRMEVSRYYSIEKSGKYTDPGTLQQVIADVTDDSATIVSAKTKIDNILNNKGFDLTTLNGTNGFRLEGTIIGDKAGFAVSSAGDINGDGFADVAVGVPHRFDDFYAGSTFVVFGKASGFDASISLSSLNGSNGFRINGVSNGDGLGAALSAAGDFNGDGVDDLLIGAPLSDIPRLDTGHAYIVFGKKDSFDATLELSALDGNNGVQLQGTLDSITGWAVAGTGDINGDKIDDIFIGAPLADISHPDSGSGYVVFGSKSGLDASIDLSALNGANGFRIDGLEDGGQLGNGVGIGDINGDGISDLLIGAYTTNPGGKTYAGTAYVIFGKSSGFSEKFDLASLDGTNGFLLEGLNEGDDLGYSMSIAGDMNGDGLDDIAIAAPLSDVNGKDSGAAYIVFGKPSGFDAKVDLSTLDGSNGFVVGGAAKGDNLGKLSISSAGDVNNDKLDDLVIGAAIADANGVDSGAAYIIYGKSSGFGANIDLLGLSSSDGFFINGVTTIDSLGQSVSSAGDVNKDGIGDLIVGAPFVDTQSGFNSGAAYILFGT